MHGDGRGVLAEALVSWLSLYGVASANLIFLPLANKLKLLSHEEQDLRTLALEGILAVQAGDNPRVVADKLLAFIPPAEREAAEGNESTGPARVAEAA